MDTATWETDEVGAYLRLLLYEWVNGGLPDDTYKLSKIVRESERKFREKWKNLSQKFTLNGNGLLINRRMEEVREEKSQFIESQREKGIKSAIKRWGNRITPVITMVEPVLQPDCNPSSSSSSSKKNKDIAVSDKPKRATPMADDQFWEETKKIYTWIDVDREIQKMKGYMITPKGKSWKMTQRRVIDWLNRIDKPLEAKHESW